MAGWGYAAGEGAEAFAGSLQGMLNYRLARAQQQMQVGIEKERLRLDQQKAILDQERIDQDIRQSQAYIENLAAETGRKEKELAMKERIQKTAETTAESKFPKPTTADVMGQAKKGRGFPTSALEKKGKEQFAKREEFVGRVMTEGFPKENPLSYSELKADVILRPDKYSKETRDFFMTRNSQDGSTQEERYIERLLDPDVSEEKKKLIRQVMNIDEIDSVPIDDINKVLNNLYPISPVTGKRANLPEDMNPGSFEFLQHGADLINRLKSGKAPEGTEIPVKPKDDYINE